MALHCVAFFMSYKEFSWRKAKQDFSLTTVEGERFLPEIAPVIASPYGSVSSGTTWRFMKLEEQTVTVDLTDYPLPPTEVILGMLLWMTEQV